MDTAKKANGAIPAQSALGVDSAPAACAADDCSRTLLIISDIRFLREGLAEVLARDGAFSVVGAAADLEDAIEIARVLRPQVMLLDAVFPNGLAAARTLGDMNPQIPIVALALTETEDDVIAWAEAGISGYVPRTAALADLVGLLREVVRGEQTCSRRVAAGLLRRISTALRAGSDPRAGAKEPALTAREAQVVRLLCAGLSNKEIARRLNIGLATTKSHVHNLLAKLELERRGQVVRWSREHPEALRDQP
jgi:two-component system, NarL family, nitrate/nitrite response regulator NarL